MKVSRLDESHGSSQYSVHIAELYAYDSPPLREEYFIEREHCNGGYHGAP